jgi:hypothetical protein
MSAADRPDPRHRILGLALQLAAYAPVRKNKYACEVRVPWRPAAGGRAGQPGRVGHASAGREPLIRDDQSAVAVEPQ